MHRIALVFAASLCFASTLTAAEKLASGPQPGDLVGPFHVVKCAGAVDDPFDVGEELCYYCEYGIAPTVMVFARQPNETLVQLSQQLDAATDKHKAAELHAFVNLLGANRDATEAAAKKFGVKAKLERVPVVVPLENENGPADYGLDPKAEVTVLIYVKSKVTASLAFGKPLTADEVQAVLAEVEKLVAK